MDQIRVDFAKACGSVKPIHATNNGPVYKFAADQRITNVQHFRAAGIPYARNHDAAFYATYGGEHCVDVNFIFTDWSADPTDPASYDFQLTDEYCRMVEAGGCKNYYRLGSKIEHWSKKYNTLPPADFHKWAVVCEHIIRHYTEGWADGMKLDIPYWEIWNEPDLDPDDATHKRCWGGTAKQFYELFNITLTHLKKCFPHLKIGGPAIAAMKDNDWTRGFFESLGEVKPDFFSWHVYGATVEKVREKILLARHMLDEYGLTECESILNEWNYVRGWKDEDWYYTLKAEKSLKAASFIASVMAMSQYEPLDMLMYYDARPGGMNGMFCTDRICETLKGYYPFWMFNQLYKLDNAVALEREGTDVWAVAAKSEAEHSVMLSYYNDDDNAASEKQLKVSFSGVESKNGVRLEYYLLDENHDAELVREEIFTASAFAAYLKMPLHGVYLLKAVAL